ncbi:N-acetyltransferase [Sinomonas cellulolyticus]|uniref:N-acetyltransferase n=1 Tax=Sinomonas cellulolyticus TaxID=2801916 RepID=A0ABS1K6L8_9MICC|nr:MULTISPECIES: GNAT family N-acetyltransferase [Sinomonas]MBL0707113.1 N-acetyltransferase [Sinomonas cellulolyticus]GHG54784.1 N-acetyltransferase [Sinomonas sp. KCTC 49339]
MDLRRAEPHAALTTRPATAADWPRIRDIYAAGIEPGDATFESAPPATWEEFSGRKEFVLVAEEGLENTSEAARVLGWTGAGRVSAREVHRGVVEHSLYVDPAAGGRGIGTLLMRALLDECRARGMWTVQATVFPENLPSLALHRKFGFREVGRRERIALMGHGPLAGSWRDTVLLELRL